MFQTHKLERNNLMASSMFTSKHLEVMDFQAFIEVLHLHVLGFFFTGHSILGYMTLLGY